MDSYYILYHLEINDAEKRPLAELVNLSKAMFKLNLQKKFVFNVKLKGKNLHRDLDSVSEYLKRQ